MPSPQAANAVTSAHRAFPVLSSTPRIRDQLKELRDWTDSMPKSDLPTDLIDYPKLEYRGEEYILEEWDKSSRKKTSWIHSYGILLIKVDGATKLGLFWCCNLCSELFAGESTSGSRGHLERAHSITDPSKPPKKKQKTEAMADIHTQLVTTAAAQQARKAAAAPEVILQVNADRIKKRLIDWIVSKPRPLTDFESPLLRLLLCELDAKRTLKELPQCADTILTWVTERFHQEQQKLKQVFKSSTRKVHLSFDLWSSPNHLPILAIFAHYFTVDGEYQTKLLFMKRVIGSHEGENLARYLIEVIVEYALEDVIGFFQSDNASPNDTCVRSVLATLFPTLTNSALNALTKKHRLRCLGHITNLAAKALIEGRAAKDLMNTYSIDCEVSEQVLLAWRKCRSVGKLHNLVHWVRRSTQRQDAFSAACKQLDVDGRPLLNKDLSNLRLVADNATRWNSVYYMTSRAIALRKALDWYSFHSQRESDSKKRVPIEDILSPDDWLMLIEINKLLEPFKITTMVYQGRKPGMIANVLIAVHVLLKDLKKARQSRRYQSPNEADEDPVRDSIEAVAATRPQRISRIPSHLAGFEVDLPSTQRPAPLPTEEAVTSDRADDDDDEEVELPVEARASIRGNLDYAIEKLEKYINLLGDAPSYWGSMLLNPCIKRKWIDDNLPSEQVARIISAFRRSYEEDFLNLEVPEPAESVQFVATDPAHRHLHHLLGDDFYSALQTPRARDEIAIYFSEGPAFPTDPITWWQNNKDRFPRLAEFAFNILSIPPMSDDCERAFSQGSLLFGSTRHRMIENTFNYLMCLLDWQGKEITERAKEELAALVRLTGP